MTHAMMPAPAGADGDIWTRLRARLRQDVGDAAFDAFFARLECDGVADGRLRLSLPTDFQAHHARDTYGAIIRNAARAVMGGSYVVAIRTRGVARAKPFLAGAAPGHVVVDDLADVAAHAPVARRLPAAAQPRGPQPLPDLTFDRLVPSPGCALAHSAVRMLCDGRVSQVFVQGDSGSGKTHLLHAAAHEMGAPVHNIYSLQGAFRGLGDARLTQALSGFPALVVDDLSDVSNRLAETVCARVFRCAHALRLRVLVASGVAMTDLKWMDTTTRSRLCGGLLVDIGPLDDDARRMIVRRQADETAAGGLRLSDAGVDHLVKTGIPPRDVAGVLARLQVALALADPPDEAAALAEALQYVRAGGAPRRVTVEDIIKLVARDFGVSVLDIRSQRRSSEVVRPRQVAHYLAKKHTTRSLPTIGKIAGGRDHTTILNSIRRIERRRHEDAALDARLQRLSAEIMAGAAS